MKLQNLALLGSFSLLATACSTSPIDPSAPPAESATKPIEVPVPHIRPAPKQPPKPAVKPKPKTQPYNAKVDRYSENAAARAEEVNGKTTIINADAAAEAKIEAESDRLDPYSKQSSTTQAKDEPVQESGGSTAVTSLMVRAKVDMLAGRSDAAISKLERAIGIQPNNAKLWNKLAEAHYHSENYKQAASMAKKSNDLATESDRSLMRGNWKLIAKARKEMGDMEGMKAAMRAENSI